MEKSKVDVKEIPSWELFGLTEHEYNAKREYDSMGENYGSILDEFEDEGD